MQLSRTACGTSRFLFVAMAPRDRGTERRLKPLRAVASFIEDLAILGRFAFGREYGPDTAKL